MTWANRTNLHSIDEMNDHGSSNKSKRGVWSFEVAEIDYKEFSMPIVPGGVARNDDTSNWIDGKLVDCVAGIENKHEVKKHQFREPNDRTSKTLGQR